MRTAIRFHGNGPLGHDEDHSNGRGCQPIDKTGNPSPLRSGRNLARGERFFANPWNRCLPDQPAPAGAGGLPKIGLVKWNSKLYQDLAVVLLKRLLVETSSRDDAPHFTGVDGMGRFSYP